MRRHRFVAAFVLCSALAFAPQGVRAGDIPLEMPERRGQAPASSPLDVAWTVLLYLPNRVFDLTDVVRLQLRAGPGWALGARATRYVPLFVGGYEATWVGVPGPRGRAAIPLPVGVAEQTGFSLGPAFSAGSHAPYYGTGEIGAGVHLYMLGFDAGFDVVELVDFFAGIATVDFSRDDF